MIKIIVNDEEKTLSDNASIETLLKEMSLDRKTMVVVVNDEIIEHTQYKNTILHDGDRVELVRIVGGG